MLRAVAAWKLAKDDIRFVEMCWALDQIDSLEDKRNDALHSPYTMVLEDRTVRLIPNYFRGNKRALNLKDRDWRLS